MKTLSEWMSEYGVSHQNKTNVLIHKVCVPLIAYSVFGILWSIPSPFEVSPFLNWATLAFLASCVFYLSLGLRVLLLALVQGVLFLSIAYFVSLTGHILESSVLIFVCAWIGQFIGHKIEGKKPSFFQDLQFLLIGPIWIFPFFK